MNRVRTRDAQWQWVRTSLSQRPYVNWIVHQVVHRVLISVCWSCTPLSNDLPSYNSRKWMIMLIYGRHVGAPPKGHQPPGSLYKSLQIWVKCFPEWRYKTIWSLYGERMVHPHNLLPFYWLAIPPTIVFSKDLDKAGFTAWVKDLQPINKHHDPITVQYIAFGGK